ncbi:MAG: hypothetical protein GY755_08220 [Chloroflexi bacterium]|nr:hypothetical protein [Chloroflexota bacterium]
METVKTYEGEDNKNDIDIGLFDSGQTGIILGALCKDIIIIKKLNIKGIIYKVDSEKIG